MIGSKTPFHEIGSIVGIRAQHVLAVLLVVVAGALAYSPSLGGEFLNMDDRDFIVNNPMIAGGLSFHSLRWALTAAGSGGTAGVDYWQPATLVSRLVDGSLYGLNPAGHRLTNLLIHLLNAVLVLFLLAAATGRLWRSALAALIFVVHPLHVSSVAWVAERKDVLSAFFSLVSLAIFARFAAAYRDRLDGRDDGRTGGRVFVWYLMLAAGYALCLMSKPMALPLPLIMLLVAIWPIAGGRRPELLRLAFSLIPLLAIAAGAVFLYTRVGIARFEFDQIGYQPPLAVAKGVVAALAAYPAQWLYPVNLQHIYGQYPREIPAWQLAASLLLLCAASATAAANVRRRPFIAVGWLWYLVALLPVAGLFHSNGAAGRFSYFPMIGVTVMIVWSIAEFAGRRWLTARVAAAAVAVIALVLITRADSRHWKDSRSLFNRLIELDPRHPLAHRNLGVVQAEAGDHQSALASYAAAIASAPNYPSAYYNMGLSLAALGREDEALAYLSEAVKLDPSSSAAALNDMGVIHLRRGDLDSALACFLDLLAMNPREAGNLDRIGTVYALLGRFADAESSLLRALDIEPGNVLFMNDLGSTYLLMGRAEQAAIQFRRALAVNPGDPVAIENLRNLERPDATVNSPPGPERKTRDRRGH